MPIPIPSVCKTNLSLFSRDTPATARGGGGGIEPSHRRIKEPRRTLPLQGQGSKAWASAEGTPRSLCTRTFAAQVCKGLVPAALQKRNGLAAWARSAGQLQPSAVIRADCLDCLPREPEVVCWDPSPPQLRAASWA